MARWLVELTGDLDTLRVFAFWFPTGDPCVVTEPKGSFMSGARMDSLESESQVHQYGQLRMDEMYAVVSLMEPGMKRPTTNLVWRQHESGEREGFGFVEASLVGAGGLRITARGTVPTDGVEPTETQAQTKLRVVKSNPHLEAAVKILALQHCSWPHLYRIHEEIQHYEGLAGRKSLADPGEIKRFKRTANAAEAAGQQARHRGGKFEPPKDPMTLIEATVFIRNWLLAVIGDVAADTPAQGVSS